MKANPTVHLRRLADDYPAAVSEALEAVGFFRDVPPGSRVFLKPNLTFPTYRPGVMTSYECLSAVTRCLIGHGFHVLIGEADSGGYNRFSMDEVFKGLGIDQLCQETGAELVNISFTEPEWMPVKGGFRDLRVPVPKLLLHDIDAFITLPVPKIHMNTLVSMSIKNQWGCIQEPGERLKLHPYFAEVMYQLNRRLPRAYSLIDGRVGLNRTGPMLGDVVDLNWILASNDLVAADRVCCKIMQIDETHVGHLMHFRKRGWWTPFEAIRINEKPEAYQKEKFYLTRAWTDYPGLLCFNNAFLAWLGYHSPLAGFAHWLLYLFREPFYSYEEEKGKLRKEAKLQAHPGGNKVLVFAHVPPPHHGQSYMVKLMLEAFGGNQRGRNTKGDLIPLPLEVSTRLKPYHVNCNISDRIDQIGGITPWKILKLIWFILDAIRCRMRHGVKTFYYVPAPGKRSALYRDWAVMAFCRPFFSRIVFHWHATGLGEWLEKEASEFEKWLSHKLLDGADVSIVLTEFNREDAMKLNPKQVKVLPNAIPDPCPDYELTLAVARAERSRSRRTVPGDGPVVPRFRFLFLSHCTRAKGLFDALDAMEILLKQSAGAGMSGIRPELIVAGSFQDPAEEREFHQRLAAPPLAGQVSYVGFVSGEDKRRLFAEADAFLFTSHWDNCPVALIEAFAYGLPVIATRTNGVPSLFPAEYPYLFEVKDVEGFAEGMRRVMRSPEPLELRKHFQVRFGLEQYVQELEAKILGI